MIELKIGEALIEWEFKFIKLGGPNKTFAVPRRTTKVYFYTVT
jgi:hypothetical protein